jgi:hypothetical protein
MNTMHIFYPELKRETRLNQFSVSIRELVLFQRVSIVVHLYTIDGKLYENLFYTLEGDEYTAWSSDDSYIISWVKTKLRGEREIDLAKTVISKIKTKMSEKKT